MFERINLIMILISYSDEILVLIMKSRNPPSLNEECTTFILANLQITS